MNTTAGTQENGSFVSPDAPAPISGPDPAQAANGSNRRVLVRVITLIAVVAVVVFVTHQLGLFRFPWESPAPIVAGDLFPEEGNTESGHLSGMTPEEIRDQMQEAADASYFSFKINARPEFENGSAEGTLGIENPSYNTYPMVVQIFLNDTEELIYDSGGILPDSHIDKARLLRPLAAGTYDATAYMNAYDSETKEWLGKQAAELVITVQN